MSETEKGASQSPGEERASPGGCEGRALSIIDEFTSLYEDRLKLIDREIGENCLEIKLPIYKKWVEDLTFQNKELVKAVEEVETVVSERLSLLEERLQQEKYNLHDRRVFHLESDIRNLLIFLRRAIRDKSWSTEGLTFHEIDLEKTLSDIRDEKEIEVAKITVEVTPESSRILTGGLEDISREVSNIREDIRNSTVIHTQDESYKVFEENAILREKLESTQRELNLLQLKNKELEKNGSQSDGDSIELSVVDLSKEVLATKADLTEMGKQQKESEKNLKSIFEELNQLKVELGLKIPEKSPSETFVPEVEMLSAIKHEFFNLRQTNSLLKVENAEMRQQVQNFSHQADHLSKQGKQLEEMQQVMSKIRNTINSFGGNQDDAEASDGDFLAKYCDVLEELKSDNARKTDDLAKKDSKIESLKDVIEKQSLEIDNLTKNQGFMASERAKNEQVIEDLKKAVSTHTDTVNELKSANDVLVKRLKDMETNHQSNEIFAKLLADKNRLEVESSKVSGSSSSGIISHNGASEGGLGVKVLSGSEMEQEGDSRMHQQNQQYSQIIDDLSNELASLSEQLLQQPQQKELIEESLQLKTLMEDLEIQNDNLQQTIETYIEQLSTAETKIQSLEFEKSNLEGEVKNARLELERKDAKIEELMRENKSAQSQLEIHRRFCTCRTSTLVVDNGNGIRRASVNMDKDTQCIEELQKLLNQKSSEASKATVALRWKSLEWGRMQQIAAEEKIKLTQQMKDLIKNVGDLKQKIASLEANLEKKEQDLQRTTQKLQIATQREAELVADISVKNDQITFFEKGEAKYREAIEELSEELSAIRTSRVRRESIKIQELNAANTSLRGDTAELEKQNSALQRENANLKSEMSSLRDEVASLEGRSKALTDLLKGNQGEMDLLKQEINRLINLETEITGIRQDKAIFEKHNQDLVNRYQTLQKDYEELQNEYKLLLEIKAQTEIILENMKMWENEHEEREKIIQKKISKQSEHINTLLDDRKMLIMKINTMHQDIVVLNSERQKYEDKFKEVLNGPSFYLANSQDNFSLPTKMIRYNSDPQLNNSESIWRRVRNTTKRLSRTRRLWEEHMKEAFH
ncbi:girdin-like isoform X2 [Phlebotomus papatasi]|uniref:girdin-like isoform X2 n=1 Tax=Phlebotomus papatasi TaxID=29031 RepID=UPI0024843C14|nr:girdin-like isoform X2 [Phlebotomus papatasi]